MELGIQGGGRVPGVFGMKIIWRLKASLHHSLSNRHCRCTVVAISIPTRERPANHVSACFLLSALFSGIFRYRHRHSHWNSGLHLPRLDLDILLTSSSHFHLLFRFIMATCDCNPSPPNSTAISSVLQVVYTLIRRSHPCTPITPTHLLLSVASKYCTWSLYIRCYPLTYHLVPCIP